MAHDLQSVQPLEADPDLGTHLGAERFERARTAISATVMHLLPGLWLPPQVEWHGLTSSTLAIVDSGVLAAGARFPEVFCTLAQRGVLRHRHSPSPTCEASNVERLEGTRK